MQLSSVPRDEGGLPQLEREQMGTFSAGAAPPLTRPGSLPSGSISVVLRRKHLAGFWSGNPQRSAPFNLLVDLLWVSTREIDTHRRANTCIASFAQLLCSVVRLDILHYADFRDTACPTLGV